MNNTLATMNWLDARESPFFRFSEYEEAGLSERTLRRLIAEGYVRKVGHGIFCERDALSGALSECVVLGMRFPEIVFCRNTAAHLHFINATPALTSDLMERGLEFYLTNSRQMGDVASARPIRTRSEKVMSVGVEEMMVYGQKILVTNRARTAIDLLLSGNSAVGQEVINRMIDEGVPRQDFIRVASQMGVRGKVEDFITGLYGRQAFTTAA